MYLKVTSCRILYMPKTLCSAKTSVLLPTYKPNISTAHLYHRVGMTHRAMHCKPPHPHPPKKQPKKNIKQQISIISILAKSKYSYSLHQGSTETSGKHTRCR